MGWCTDNALYCIMNTHAVKLSLSCDLPIDAEVSHVTCQLMQKVSHVTCQYVWHEAGEMCEWHAVRVSGNEQSWYDNVSIKTFLATYIV